MKWLHRFSRASLVRSANWIDWKRRDVRDALVVSGIAALTYAFAEWVDLFNAVAKFQQRYGDWGLDDIVLVCAVLSLALLGYGWRRLRDVSREVRARQAAEAETERRMLQLDQAKTFLNAIIENVPAVIAVKELPDLRYTLVNRDAEKFLGLPREQILGKTAAELFPEGAAEFIRLSENAILESQEPVMFQEQAVATPGNGMRVAIAGGMVMPGKDREPGYLLTVVQDVTERVTERKRAEAQIAHLARHDSLTDLPNRTAFNERIENTMVQAAADGESFAVLCIDLDRFKEVNDVFGHSTGDGLLREIAKRIQAVCESAFVARLGGDEFTIICNNGPLPSAAEALANRLLESVSEDIHVAGHTLRSGMSVGIAIYPADGADTAALLANADAALYRAKAEARGSIQFFSPDMDRRLRKKRALQHDLRSALPRGELVLYYQPQASISGEVLGFESLVRWIHPTRGMVSPADFIPLAEESGIILPMGEWILREACREAASWTQPLQVAVNCSPVQFQHGDLAATVHSVLLETGLAANRLEIEITEGVLINDFPRAISVLRRIKALGVHIAMDDFGTGYSSLSYLQAFPFDKIKIDQAFIANLQRNPQSAAIIRAVIGLGRGLDLPVIAEGVETAEQLAFLAHEACDQVQGYLIGRPGPIINFGNIVGHRPAKPVALAS